MANSYWDVSADWWVSRQNGSGTFGNGLGPRLQSGYNSGSDDYENRFCIAYRRPTSGSYVIPSGATITKATAFLKVRGNPGGVCFSQGSAPKLLVQRVNDPGYVPVEISQSGECNLSSGGGTGRWPGPLPLEASGAAFWQGTPSTGDVISIEVTTQFLGWWGERASGDNDFTEVFMPSNAAGTAEEQATARRIAFYSADGTTAMFDGGNGSYLLVEYTTTTAPDAPTLTSPANAARVTQPANVRAFSFVYEHPTGVAGTEYNVQVSTVVGMTSPVVDKTVALAMVDGTTYNRTLDTVADFTPDEVRGSTYYWRVRCKGDGVYGNWSAVRSYVVNRLPVNTQTWPPP